MKKIVIPFLFFCFSGTLYSQEKAAELTEEQKEALRKNYNSGLQFSTKKETVTKSIEVTNTEEEQEKKVTKVSYYYGTQDTTYKEFQYIKPE